MSKKSDESKKSSDKSVAGEFKVPMIIMGVISLVGVVFAALLYQKSVALAAGVGGGVSCEVGTLDCKDALTSPYAHLFGINLTVLAGAFYFSILGLLFFLRRANAVQMQTAGRFMVISWLFALGMSGYLAYIAFAVLPTACPFCMVLYGVNIGGLGVSFMFQPKMKEFLREFGDGMKALVTSPAVQSAIIVFLMAGVVLAFSYNQWVESAAAANEEAQTKEGKQAASQIDGDGQYDLDLEGLPRLGPADAPVTLVEFSDFECPHCQRFSEIVHEVHEAYPDNVAIYFAHYPLDAKCNSGSTIHPNACFAAAAATCAQDQDKFWPMHDEIFGFYKAAHAEKRRANLTEDVVLDMGNRIGLQAEPFLACLSNEETNERIKAQVALGKQVEVSSTPTWLLNGHKRKGARPFAYIAPQIDRLLEIQKKEAGAEDSSEASADDESASDDPATP